jgi:phenylalanyl-tRNA synthetase alpha chain
MESKNCAWLRACGFVIDRDHPWMQRELTMLDEISNLRREAEHRLAALKNLQELDDWRRAYLGRVGTVSALLRRLGRLPQAERPGAGRAAHALKQALDLAYEAHKKALAVETRARLSRLDVTLPGRPPALGKLHPVTQTLREMRAAFAQMGFQVYSGPEIEEDRYNFTLLNMPPHHPARDQHDTFYTTRPGLLLRTHTSPNQVRLMQRLASGLKRGETIRLVVPGKVYRYEDANASHDWMFQQMEGLVVGRNVHMGHLLGTIRAFARQVFGPQRKVRFRCDYFPYVEPGLDTAVSCLLCNGTGDRAAVGVHAAAGCRVCAGTGWLEAIPGGMVHPQVLRNCDIDPNRYGGFAFGAGADRIALLKYGIDDIRRFYGNDSRFQQQF